MLCAIFESYIKAPKSMENIGEKNKVKSYICQVFIFSYLWAFGGNLTEASREKFEVYVLEQFEEHPDAKYIILSTSILYFLFFFLD